jgi:hypothetical protein
MTSPNFCSFMIISPLKRTWPFIWTIYNLIYPRMTCTKFNWNWPDGSEEYFFFNINTSDWLIDYLLFYVPLKNISLIWRRHHCWWRAAKFRPMLGALGLWAGRDLYCATPTVTRGLRFSGLIRRTTTFSRLFRNAWGRGGPILTRRIWFSLLWSLPTPGDHDVNKSECTLYKKVFM